MIRPLIALAALFAVTPAQAMTCHFNLPNGGTNTVVMRLDAEARTISANAGHAPLMFNVIYDDDSVIVARNVSPSMTISLRFDVATGHAEQRVTSRVSGQDVLDMHGVCGR